MAFPSGDRVSAEPAGVTKFFIRGKFWMAKALVEAKSFLSKTTMSHTPSGSNSHAGPSGSQNITFNGPYGSSEPQNAAQAAQNTSGHPDFTSNNPESSGLSGGGPHSGVFPLQLQHPPGQQVLFQHPIPSPQLAPPHPQYQQQPPPFQSIGFPQPIQPFQGMGPPIPPQMAIPLRITLGNIIAHSEGCAVCTNYIAHMAMASTTDEFNEIMSQRDSHIRGTAPSSSSGTCNHELLISSLQEQLSSLRGMRDIERQTMGDRILALELERDDYCERYHQERAQVDELTRENDELNESRRYWKYRYGTLDREAEPKVAGPSSSGSKTTEPATQVARDGRPRNTKKSDRKGKGREVPMVPLEQRISHTEGMDSHDSNVPLARRMSPMREDMELTRVPVSTTASSDAGSVVVRLPLNTLSSEFNPHVPPRVEEGSGRSAEPYEGPYSSTPTGVTRLTLPESSDVSDDFEPDPHPNRLKGEARLRQNRINKEAKRKMYEDSVRRNKILGLPPPQKNTKRSKKREFDALRRDFSKEEFQQPTTAEEVDTINHALRESDSFTPPRLMWRTMQGMRRIYEYARAIPAANRSELERALVSRFNYIPKWYNDALAAQKKKPFVFPNSQLSTTNASRHQTESSVPHDSSESLNPAAAEPTTESSTARPRQSLQTRLAEVQDSRAWEGLTEDHTIAEWAERMLHTPSSDHLPGVRLEMVDYTFAANTRGIRGMLEVQRLLPNVLGLNDTASLEANIYIHLVLCELAYLPGITPHSTHRPGPLPMYAGPVGIEQITFDLSLRGYTRDHLSDMSLYLMWWIEDVAHQIPNLGSYTSSVTCWYNTLIEEYRVVDQISPNTGRFAELQLIREALIPKADRIAPNGAEATTSGTATNDVPAPAPSSAALPPEAGISTEVPEPVDWDQMTHDANGDPILDYGEGDDTGMDIAR
ncbi:hypothetical protein EV360DRAFT_75646 [Lentinula raphanica]|nr:hypothetical protein EV360DRAFT_75646 [Lentinula raphanica]